MSAVRRLYFYVLSLISFEVVIWGVVSLLRTIVSRGLISGGSLLATGLSLVLVGLPIFLLHWRTVQRDALRDLEERASRIRAVFFYTALFATLLPILSSVLALLNRGLVVLLGQPAFSAWIGREQSTWDNIIAIIINAVAFAYFWSVLHRDWLANPPDHFLVDARRLYRYLLVLIGLTLTVSGVYNLLRYLLSSPGINPSSTVPMLAGAIALLVVGLPLWIYQWQVVQTSLVEPGELRSLLRLVVLYIISMAGVVGVLSSAGRVLNSLLRWGLGEAFTLSTFLQNNSAEIGALVPLAGMWWFYGHILNQEVAALPDQPRRAALRRLYDYILSLLGLGVTFAGLISMADFLAQLAFSQGNLVGSFRSLLSGALSALLVGLPLWLITWREMQREAAREDNAGDHARRSVLRKTYLYLVLFLLVIGAMFFTGQLLYTLLNALLSGGVENIAVDVTRMVLSLVIDVFLLVYHWRALRDDSHLAQQTLGSLHAAFPTLIMVEEEVEGAPRLLGDETRLPSVSPSEAFSEAILAALSRSAPRLPVAVHSMKRGAPDEAMLGAKAILLPLNLALNPPESLRLWLADYPGRRILIPLPASGWSWFGAGQKRPQEMAREAAQALRQIAEGESVRQSLPNSPWAIAGYILGGLAGLQLLIVLFVLLISSLFR